MVNEEKLSSVLSEFARTVITDFPIQAILDHLVTRIVEVLPITSAGVTLIAAGAAPHYIAASDSAALRFENLQSEIGEGPCTAAFETGEAVICPDISVDRRFPRFAKAASARGLAAAFTFPLRHGDERLGALDLYRDTPGELDGTDTAAAQTLADVTSAYLLNARSRSLATVEANHLLHLSTHDPLTGLPNRLLFQQRLEHAALRARRSRTNTAVLFADLDQFKLVNDSYDHTVGDGLLTAVANRLTTLLRPGDTLARFSGDEFVILCEDLSSASDVDGLAERISAALLHPFVIGGVLVEIRASVGIAYAGAGQEVSNRLVVEADRAMYTAKQEGGGRHRIVDIRASHETTQHASLESDFRDAFVDGELDLAYQPIVSVADGTVVGVEALLRWNHRDRGPVSPLAMIAIAERSGLISDLGAWVLERACTDRQQWTVDDSTARIDVAVNVSACQLLDPAFATSVGDILAAAGMEPAALTLEITESVFIEDGDRAILALSDLQAAGVRLAVDDFGTGYSSLSYLARLPIDIVKIDRCFISDSETTAGRIIAGAITNLAHDLGFAVIAEGVETRREHDQIKSFGCELAQGFLYARPMPASAVRSYHAARCGSGSHGGTARTAGWRTSDVRRDRNGIGWHSV